MAQFRITAPDGQQYNITAPEGATEQQALEHFKSQWKPEAPAAKPQTVGDYASGLTRAVTQGMTFNLGDEAASAGSAVNQFIKGILTGEGFGRSVEMGGEGYRRNKAYEAGERKGFSDQNPVSAVVGELLGGVASAAPRAGAALAAPTSTLRAAGQGAATGATMGGVAGFGSGEGIEDSLGRAGIGAGTGAVVGGAVPLVANVVARGAGKVTDALGLRNPEAGATRQVLRAYERDAAAGGPTIPQVQARVAANAANRGGTLPEMIPDLSGENVKTLARTATSVPGASRQAAQSALEKRAEEQGSRLYDKVNRALAPDEFYQAETKFLATLKNNAGDAYDAARKASPYIWSKDLDALMSRPTMRNALGGAMKNAADEGKPFGMIREGGRFMRAEDFNRGDRIEALSLQSVDDVKRALDSIIETEGQNPLTGALNNRGRIVTSLKNQFLGHVEKADKSGLYAAARKQYAGDAEVVTALRDGRDFRKLDPEQITARVQAMSVAERDAYRSGVARDLKDQIDRVQDGADATRRIFGNAAIRSKIEAAFDSPKEFAKFRSFMEREANMANSANVYGPRVGSHTQKIAADQADMQIDPPYGVLANLAVGNWRRAAANAGEGIMRRAQGMNSSTSDALAPMLFAGSPQEQQAVLAKLLSTQQQGQAQTLQNRALGRALLGGIGAGTGGQFDRQ